jgi:hypothetical protein
MEFRAFGSHVRKGAVAYISRAVIGLVALRCGRASAYGIPLVSLDYAKDGVNELFFAKVTLALGLIDKYDHRRLSRMRRDLSAIWLVRAGGAYFEVSTRRCVLSWQNVVADDARSVAMTLVHEAAHARISGRGVVKTPRAIAARHEAAAIRQQIAFATLLPDNESLLKYYSTVLQTPWWTPEQMRERQLEQLRAYDLPDWVVRLAMRRMPSPSPRNHC